MHTKYLIGGAIGLGVFMLLRSRAQAAPAGVGEGNAERDTDRIVDYEPSRGVASTSLGAQVRSGSAPKNTASAPSVLTQVQRGTGSAAAFVTDAARAGANVLGGIFSAPPRVS